CPGGPVNLRHVHGTADPVVPMQGRPIGDTWIQGNVREGWRLWLENGDCAARPDRVERSGGLSCEVWSSCASGKELRLCLHPGGHKRIAGWVEDSVSWVESLVR
ncbi:MAG: polyhydroxybutyrate depolymerase, partial [Gammaproteobacteria bacterium]